MWIQQNDRQAACRDIQVLPQYHVVLFGRGFFFLFYSRMLEEITCYEYCLGGIHNNGTDNEYLIQITDRLFAQFPCVTLSEILFLSAIFLRQ